ncbi:unnamed protein product, partial [Meganyctiphanes norvegica]
MNEAEREKLFDKYVTKEVHISLTVKNVMKSEVPVVDVYRKDETLEEVSDAQHTCNVGGVFLTIYNKENASVGMLVDLPSTRRNLECLALAISRRRPILLEGVVGSGKTSLVEHMASLTGRTKSPHLTKVQLSDQTDSKILLGTYCCTQTPGEFIWRPGSLTRAVREGHWLLLEDLDYAPMDIISMLIPLLESRTLSLAGHGNVTAHPDFQVFGTRRTSEGTRLVSGNAGLIDKLWAKVSLETLPRSELIELICTKWPKLTTLADKFVSVYLMLSAGKHSHDTDANMEHNAPDLTSIKTSGRLVSTRDLMKWCTRVNMHIDKQDMDLAVRAFLEALDCFCMAVPESKIRYKIAEQIGSFMNRTQAEVDYYFNTYKPEVKQSGNELIVGQRTKMKKKKLETLSIGKQSKILFSYTKQAVNLMERIGVSVMNQEPVLIVGETGTGKTSTVQYLAHMTRNKLRVINMNQQSDSSDLLGGFKPVEMKTFVSPLRQDFEELFATTFSTKQNNKFLQHIMVCFHNQKWSDLFTLMMHSQAKALEKLESDIKIAKETVQENTGSNNQSISGHEHEIEVDGPPKKKKKRNKQKENRNKEADPQNKTDMNETINGIGNSSSRENGDINRNLSSKVFENLKNKWIELKLKIASLKEQVEHVQSALAFSFIEGTLVKAIKEGDWVLLDEINLANAETLECLSGLLESRHGSLMLLERGDNQPINRHPNFRLFACMNPATDVGKKELPPGLRNRFTEFYMEELNDKQDLMIIINDYLNK